MDAVFRAIAALNPDLRDALLLRDIVGLSYAEIAESLEISLATTKWRIFKARELTAERLVAEGVLRPPGAATSLASRLETAPRAGRRAARAVRPRGSPPARSRCRTPCAWNVPGAASVSSSSQAARGSRSRG